MALPDLPEGLPPGRPVARGRLDAGGVPVGPPTGEPLLWVSDEPVPDAGVRWARLLADHPRTGLWPLLLTMLASMRRTPTRPWHNGELAPVAASGIDEVDVDAWLARRWRTEVRRDDDFGADAVHPVPFDAWPGLADAARPEGDPDAHAASLAESPDGAGALTGRDDVLLGLVPAADGAEAIASCGWIPPSTVDAVGCAAVVRSWQRRFGARLCHLGFDTLAVTAAWPPRDREHALRVAAEHYAFCPELLAAQPLEDHATDLLRAGAWLFWWD